MKISKTTFILIVIVGISITLVSQELRKVVTDVVKAGSQLWVKGVDRTSFFDGLNSSNDVTSINLADGSVDEDKIIDNAIQNRHIEDMQVGWAEAALDLRDSIRAGYGGDSNSPDNITTETKSGGTIGVRDLSTILRASTISELNTMAADSVGMIVYLEKISNSNTTGGGNVIYQTSGWTVDNISVFAASSGFWVRLERLLYPKVWRASWLGTNSGSTSQIISNLIKANTSNRDIIILDNFNISGGFSFDTTNVRDSLTIVGMGMYATRIRGGIVMPNHKNISFKDLTIDASYATGGDAILISTLDSSYFELLNVRVLAPQSGAHAIQTSGNTVAKYTNIKIDANGTSHGVAIRGGELQIAAIEIKDAGNGITVKSADSDKWTHDVNIVGYKYIGSGTAILLESTDGRIVNNVSFTGVTVDSGATRIMLSSIYDAGLGVRNGDIRNVSLTNVTAPYLKSGGITLDNLENVVISNVIIDSVTGYAIFVDNSTGKLNWSGTNILVGGASTANFNSLNGCKYLLLNGQVQSKAQYRYSLEGIHALEEYGNGSAEGAIFDLSPLDSAFGSWRPGIEFRIPAPPPNNNTQNMRFIGGAFKTAFGGTYFNSGYRNTLVSNNNAHNPTTIWETWGYNGGAFSWGIGNDTLDYWYYVDSYKKGHVLTDGSIPGSWYNKTFALLNMFASSPSSIMTDVDVNQKYTSSASAATDTSSIYSRADVANPFTEWTSSNGKKVKITSETTTTAGDSISEFIVVYINGVRRKIQLRAD